MSEPSTQWTEVVADDEQARHEAFAATVVALQSRINAKQGPGRAFHRKPVAALTGRLVVSDDLPDYAARGLFARPGQHPLVIRMSNGSVVAQPDAMPDIRGFAFSARGIAGPGALGQPTDRQDFLLINWPAFGFRDSREFAALVPAAAKGQQALLKHTVDRHGVVGGSMEMLRQTSAIMRPFTGFATSQFHSCAPVAWGAYAAHVHVVPQGAGRNLLAWRDWGSDVRDRIARQPLQWHVRAQFFTDEQHTPIEDGRRPWQGPSVTVGTLVADALADASEVEADHFDPWMALAEHRPLGEIMRARKAAYWPSYQNRRT